MQRLELICILSLTVKTSGCGRKKWFKKGSSLRAISKHRIVTSKWMMDLKSLSSSLQSVLSPASIMK